MLWQLDEAAGRCLLETPGLDLEVSRTGEFTTPFDHPIKHLITPLLQCLPYFADPLAWLNPSLLGFSRVPGSDTLCSLCLLSCSAKPTRFLQEPLERLLRCIRAAFNPLHLATEATEAAKGRG